MLKEELKEWLLAGEPWVVYRTLTDLLDKDEEDNVVVTAKKAIPQHPFTLRKKRKCGASAGIGTRFC